MIRLRPFVQNLTFYTLALAVGAPPMALLAMQWALALRATFWPETTCWIAASGGKFLLSTEGPIILAYFASAVWLPIAVVCVGLAYFIQHRGFGKRLVMAAAFGAISSIALLYFGTGLAGDIELAAFQSIREQC